MSIRKITKGATRTYKSGVGLVGNTVNLVMKPATKMMTRVTKRVPVVGRSLTRMAGVPRRVTRGTTSMIIALPRTTGSVAHAMFDPLLAMGLSPSGKPKRISQKPKSRGKKKPKSRGKK